jgi:hypothetical protein
MRGRVSDGRTRLIRYASWLSRLLTVILEGIYLLEIAGLESSLVDSLQVSSYVRCIGKVETLNLGTKGSHSMDIVIS